VEIEKEINFLAKSDTDNRLTDDFTELLCFLIRVLEKITKVGCGVRNVPG